VYGFDLDTDSLTDHFTDSVLLTSKEVSENRAQKTAHAFYGRMSFPDELDRPARTQMATQLRVSRETTVIGASDGGYRRLTVRESSSVQAFPITYQWWGRSEGLRYKLVGNAVAPPVAFAAAQAILAAARRPVPATPYVVKTLIQRLPEPVVSARVRRPLPLNRRFHQHIQSSRVPGFRVDIDNEGKPSRHPAIYIQGRPAPHLVGWEARLFRGSGKAVRDEVVDMTTASEYLARQLIDERDRERARRFVQELSNTFERLPDATTMQAVRAERIEAGTSPYEVIERIDELVQRYFDASPRLIPISAAGRNRLVPPRSAAALLAAAFVCDVLNRGRSWLTDHGADAYLPEEWVSRRARRRKTRNLDLSREFRGSFERALKKWRPTRAAIEADRLRRAEQLQFPASS
jgi:DNA (cytosine-5)-methyltransferase 1